MSSNEPLARAFAEFASSASKTNFPPRARARALDAVTDCIGCMIAGRREPLADKLTRLMPIVAQPDGLMNAAVIGRGYAKPSDAALLHGAVVHALDFDDTNHPAYAHPSAVIVSALLAAAAGTDARGSDLVAGYIVGFEMMGKLGRALNKAHYIKGWHATGTFGALAASVAVGALLRLPPEQIVTSMSIAASMASGVRANFGTMVKPFHAGLAARAGVESALLAQEGFTASPEALEHRFGYLAVFAGNAPARPEFLTRPGEELEILTEYGLALKPYPSCGGTHPGIEAAIRLHDGLEPGETIERVRVGISEMARNPLIYDRAENGLQGKFCMQYCAAAALLDGKVDLATFDDARVVAPDALALTARVEVEVDERVRDDSEFATAVRIWTSHGRDIEELVMLAMGKPERWMAPQVLAAKFLDCARHGGAADSGTAILGLLRKLDSDLPIDRLTPELATCH